MSVLLREEKAKRDGRAFSNCRSTERTRQRNWTNGLPPVFAADGLSRVSNGRRRTLPTAHNCRLRKYHLFLHLKGGIGNLTALLSLQTCGTEAHVVRS